MSGGDWIARVTVDGYDLPVSWSHEDASGLTAEEMALWAAWRVRSDQPWLEGALHVEVWAPRPVEHYRGGSPADAYTAVVPENEPAPPVKAPRSLMGDFPGITGD